ncbi:hypothetical protein Gohar_010087 [Gossypium harknessii]|uniref:MADS-box domain-containing protein n=1 Tax=Gossypium harknessii TaxID=34285 RepID=A0A7J9GQH5_9ROSI|nr:hypothetical protein [Gossypium harknessii]
MELTTLCGTEACLVMYSPNKQPPVVWPSHNEVQRLIERFYQAPEFELGDLYEREDFQVARST